MKLSCDEATAICDKSQYGASSFLEKVKLNLHILLCKKCGMYSKQNGIMSKCYKNQQIFEGQKKCCLTSDEKNCMDQKIKEQL